MGTRFVYEKVVNTTILIGYTSDEIEIIMQLLITLCLMAFKDLEETCLCRQYNIELPTSIIR